MNIRKALLATTVGSLLAAPLVALAAGFAQTVPNFAGTVAGSDLLGAIKNIVNTLLTLAGIIAAVYIVIGGVRYITSRGDDDAAATAKNTILYAGIGIIVILLSAVITNFIIKSPGA